LTGCRLWKKDNSRVDREVFGLNSRKYGVAISYCWGDHRGSKFGLWGWVLSVGHSEVEMSLEHPGGDIE
jgi:hypothetical protein